MKKTSLITSKGKKSSNVPHLLNLRVGCSLGEVKVKLMGQTVFEELYSVNRVL